MATVKGILGQAAPAADTTAALYKCPTGKNATVKVTVANRGAVATFRVWIAIDDVADANAQYIAFDAPIAANEPLSSVALMISGDDEIRVRANTANVSFTCSGIEQDD